ncbi:MAG: hypothetical protein JKY42_01900 [Flavobacteriales bacterium]|nr:hypothetical protein [Flavobacteriales bacterium]
MNLESYIIFFGIMLFALASYSQNNLEYQLPKAKRYVPEEVIDSIHGIDMYERLNFRLSWDSIRNCKGYACNGLIRDYYVDSSIIHKGFYVDGQLNNYTNYYPDGKLERSFKIIDDFRSVMILYYPNGIMKSKHKYNDIIPYYWEDFYTDGQQSYFMEMSNDLEYHLTKKHWSEEGALLGELILENKKKLIFQQNDYYHDGTQKVKGHLIYEQKLHSHTKHGRWMYYDETGKLTKTETYEHDRLAE